MEKEEIVKRLEGMMDSCFAYGGVGKESYNFKEYILPYKEKLNDDNLFEETYNRKLSEFEEMEVIHGVYTDSEGLTYNSIVRKTKN